MDRLGILGIRLKGSWNLEKKDIVMIETKGQLPIAGCVRASMNAVKNTCIEKHGFKRAEAAIYLGIAKTTVDRLTKRGLLHPSRALRHPIYSKDDLDRFLQETSEPIG
jgi:ribosomal protein S20